MAPKKKLAKKSEGESTSATKPAQRKSTKTEKKSACVAKKPPPKKSMGKTAAIKKETKKNSIKVTGEASAVIKVEEISDKPAGNTRAATKKEPKDKPTKPARKPVTAKRRPPKPAAKTSAAAKEPSSELDGFSSEDTWAASPNRKRKTEDKWTETTDLPVPKSTKLNPGRCLLICTSFQKDWQFWAVLKLAHMGQVDTPMPKAATAFDSFPFFRD